MKEYRVTAQPSLRVRSGPGTNFRHMGSAVQGLIVREIERAEAVSGLPHPWIWADGVNGWLRTDYLEEIRAERLKRPTGLTEIKRIFGEEGGPAASRGRLRLPQPVRLGWEPTIVQVVACHELMVPLFEVVFAEIHATNNWHLIRTWDGIYNKRRKTSSSTQWSTHSWGIAVDLNAATNRFGTQGDMPKELIDIFQSHGFIHLRNDPMHFQYALGY